MASAQEVSNLQQEITRLKSVQVPSPLAGYEEKEIAEGVYAFIEKNFSGKLRSARKLCPKCFHNGSEFPMTQSEVRKGRTLLLTCNNCGTELPVVCYKDEQRPRPLGPRIISMG
jgi:hypothetical protein